MAILNFITRYLKSGIIECKALNGIEDICGVYWPRTKYSCVQVTSSEILDIGKSGFLCILYFFFTKNVYPFSPEMYFWTKIF